MHDLGRSSKLKRLIAIIAATPAVLAAAAPASPPAAPAPLRRGDFRLEVLLSGELRAAEQLELVVPRVPQWRTTIRAMAEDGTRAAAGDVVVQLDNTDYTSEIEEKRLAISRTSGALSNARAEARQSLADKAWEVEKARLELEKARIDAEVPLALLPRREFEERRLAVERAAASFAKAEETAAAEARARAAEEANLRLDLDKARRELEAAEQGTQRLSIRAPRAGLVLVAEHPWEKRRLQVGDIVWVRWTLLSLPDLSAMRVEALLSDVDDGRIAAGMPARVVLDSHPERSYAARVAEIPALADRVEPSSHRRAFRVLLDLDETDPERMLPGMSAEVVVEALALTDQLLAPRGALVLDGEGGPRFRTDDGHLIGVRLGPCNAQDCVVAELLDSGSPDAATLAAR